jgi:hypothetical protein
MINELRLLDEEAIALKTKCVWRNQEIDNIRAIISLYSQFTEKGRSIDDNSLIEAKKRLEQLRHDPEDAGRHNIFKNLSL